MRVHPFHQHALAVGELQAFDVQEGIHAIAAGHGIGHRPHVIGNVSRAFGVLGHHIFALPPRVYGSVKGRAAGRGTRQDFPHGFELTWVVSAVEHERDHVDHAVEAGDLWPGVVDVAWGIHRNAHVQPFIAIDQVIAATAFDQVATIAAEHDVAGGKAGGRQPGIGQELLQAADQCHVGQCAAGGTAMVEDGHGIDVIALEHIGVVRAGHPFHLGEAVEDAGRRGADRVEYPGVLVWCIAMGLGQRGQAQVNGNADLVVLVGNPVEAGHAVHLVLSIAADKDVIATLADHFIKTTAPDKDVVADHLITQQRRKVVTWRTVLGALLDPVIPLVAGGRQVGLGTEDEVITLATEGGGNILGGDDEVLTVAAQNQVAGHQHAASDDHVVTGVALQAVVAERVGDDVVTCTAQHGIVASTTFKHVVAGIAVNGIVTFAGNDDVVAGSAAQHHMVFTGVVQEVAVGPNRVRVVANHQRYDFHAVDFDAARWVGLAVGPQPGELVGLVHFQGEGGREEHGVGKVGDVGVGHDQLGKGVVLQFRAEVHARRARQVVKAVAVLQRFQLGFEDKVEAGTQHAAEGHFFLGQAADPEVDGIDTCHRHAGNVVGRAGDTVFAGQRHVGIGAGAVEEVQAIGRRAVAAKHQRHCGGALGRFGGGPGDGGVGAVGGDEVDQRRRVLEVVGKIDPADVGLELAVTGCGIELAARLVQAGDTGVTATGDVQRRQVQRQAKQVVAQRLGDELVDFVAQLAGHAANDRTGCFIGGGTAAGEGQRVEEGGNQAQLLIRVGGVARHRVEVGVEAVDGFGQHRVAEAVHHMGELGEDGRVDRRVVAVGGEELVDLRLNGARELFEHQVLVLHFGAELGGLEQPLAVPYQCGDAGWRGGDGSDIVDQPLVEERQVTGGQQGVLGLLHQAVVLGVEHMVHGSKADVFVHPAVTGDVVGVEQFVVVGQVVAAWANWLGVAYCGVGIGLQHTAHHHGRGVVGNVVKEAMPGAHGVGQADRRVAVAFDQLGDVVGRSGNTIGAIVHPHHHLRHAVGPTQEVAIGIGGQQRHAVHVGVGQVDTQHVTGLSLDHRPGGHAAILAVAIVSRAELAVRAQVAVGDQPPGGHRVASGIQRIFAQKHLMRGVRAVGLALVDERRGGVGLAIVGRAHHAVSAGGAYGA